jgi:AAT family amino acid transporter
MMNDMAGAVEREGGLHRSLTTGQLSMIAIGGAIGTGLFLGSAFAIGLAGPSVIISYAIGGLIALLLMGCLAEMTIAHPASGSFGLIAELYVSPLAGFLVRYAYLAGTMLAVGTEITAIAIYMKYWLPDAPGWWWILGFSTALVAVNASSVRTFGAVEYAFSFIKIAAIALFILLGAYVVFDAAPGSGIGFDNYTAHGGFLPNGLWGMWVAVIIAIFSYFSIEMIAVAAGEAKDPRRAIVRAFRATLFRLAFFYIATLALMLAIVPWTDARQAAPSSPSWARPE